MDGYANRNFQKEHRKIHIQVSRIQQSGVEMNRDKIVLWRGC